MPGSAELAPSPGAFAPLGQRAFALLWTATLISNVGTWMHEVGAGWLMTTLSPDPAVVTLVQAATTLPVFAFALLAGTLADRLDKRRMLIVINALLALVVLALALIVRAERATPEILILFTLAIGTGTAFMAPAWQAIVPQLVPRRMLKQAIGLNSMGINISRAIGPALAGVLIAGVGIAAPFALNALSHVVILGALLLWRPDPPARTMPHGPILRDMTTGIRHVRNNDAMRATLVRAAAFFLFASSYWALLPLVAQGAEGGGAALYGSLMGLIGAGAVCGAIALPRLGRNTTVDRIARIGSFGTAGALLMMALAPSGAWLGLAAFLSGMSWIAVLTSINVSAQTALPDWVRARGLAVNLMVFFGAMATGALFWGQIASLASVPIALSAAAAGLLGATVLTRKYTLGMAGDLDLTPSAMWPAAPADVAQDAMDRPSMVTVTYRVAPADTEAFLEAVAAFAKQRLRDGATQWHLHECLETPGVWMESFHLPSWQEHLAQHQRITRADSMLQQTVQRYHTGATPPEVLHWLAPR